MPIISTIGRRSPGVRALVLTIYALLLAGAVTMVYPFLLMVAGSTKSSVDRPYARIVPAFLTNDDALYRKYVEGLFNEKLDMLQYAYNTPVSSFRAVTPPAASHPALVTAWREFLEEASLLPQAYNVGFLHTPASRGAIPHRLRRFKRALVREYNGDIRQLNHALGTRFVNWNAFYVRPRNFLVRQAKPEKNAFTRRVTAFTSAQPVEARYYFSPGAFYALGFLRNQYGQDIARYNRAHNTRHTSWSDIVLSRRAPEGNTRAEWETFVRSLLNLLWVRAEPEGAEPYRNYLEAKYHDVASLNRLYQTDYKDFSEIPLVGEPPDEGLRLSDWDTFLQGWTDPETGERHQLPTGALRVESVAFRFQDFLEQRYGTVDKVNRALGLSVNDWRDIRPPQAELHYQAFMEKKAALRREFAVRNYLSVIDYLVLHGRGIVNTAVYCLLAILAALLINPLAAYALSRYKPPSSYKVLLFLMLTMSFPPMVTQIPVFLMLRQFHLLNTFWALVLPGLANGYSIFLLKGFFDSLPQELYESAAIDGAGEFRIFWQITMSLSKPILAVIALQAFTLAYANFMMAMLICQDEKMWTLMPWLYQLQQRSGQGVVFASLLIAALPTFLVFAFCQNIIMRGIVVPVEK